MLLVIYMSFNTLTYEVRTILFRVTWRTSGETWCRRDLFWRNLLTYVPFVLFSRGMALYIFFVSCKCQAVPMYLVRCIKFQMNIVVYHSWKVTTKKSYQGSAQILLQNLFFVCLYFCMKSLWSPNSPNSSSHPEDKRSSSLVLLTVWSRCATCFKKKTTTRLKYVFFHSFLTISFQCPLASQFNTTCYLHRVSQQMQSLDC